MAHLPMTDDDSQKVTSDDLCYALVPSSDTIFTSCGMCVPHLKVQDRAQRLDQAVL